MTTTTADGPSQPAAAATGQQVPRTTLLMEVAIRCTAISCTCDCFSPCKAQIRICDGCGHGWVSHALDKLGFRHLFNCHQVEVVQPSIAFDVASLMLYGTQAIPVRLKILLDRLFSVLQHDEVLQVLHGFGWTYEDYARGYIIHDPSGAVLDRWLLASREEEPLILQQFLRFGETKTIAQQLLLQESGERTDFVVNPPRTDSDIKKFIERTNHRGGSLFKQHSSHIYSHMGCPPKASFRLPSSSSNQSVSPTMSSPINCTSPGALSPLNKLQNMQPYDFRQDSSKHSPELPKDHPAPPQVPSNLTSNHSSYTTASSDRSGGHESEEDDGAINLTRSSLTSGGSYMDSVYAAKKVRHLRKSANPMKRRWNPTVLATLSTNPATGKKRVQCHVCLKTFCDKGALKIHFSAVHLREMHKCTVDGCNMMFSSRRSRNRHSANPNPKLHTPNYRRKMNPNDGRAANPYPIMPPSGMLDFSNGMVNYSSGPHDGESTSGSEDDNRAVTPPMDVPSAEIKKEMSSPRTDKLSRLDDDEPLPLTKRVRVDPDVCNKYDVEGIDLSLKEECRQPENFVDGYKNFKFQENEKSKEVEKAAERFTPLPKSNDKLSSEEHNGLKVTSQSNDMKEVKSETNENEVRSMEKERSTPSNKVVRKRKSMNPTKCRTTSDDDLPFVSSDDSSSDTYIDQDNDENGVLDSKSDYLTSDGSDSMDDMDDNSDADKDKLARIKSARKSSVTSQSSSLAVDTAPSISTKGNADRDNHERFNGFLRSEMDKFPKESHANPMKDGEDICENPLRHLESLSLGAFTNMMNMSNRSNFNPRANNVSSGVSYHAPGLGLASVTTTTAPPNNHRVESPAADMLHLPPPPPCHLTNNNNSDTDNSMSEQQMVPVYRDASMVGQVEIPVDKENPRRCTACGKIFQNHFGVKTHYQNVHLKLMHKCTVEGCNAAFPSKRSRDRHSANLNLHRKLLSTSSDRGGYFDKGVYPFHPESYRGDIFTRLYDHNSLPLSFADIYHNRLSADGTGSPFLGGSPFAHLPGAMPGFHPAFLPTAATMANFNSKSEGNRFLHEHNSGRNSSLSSISNPSSPGPSPGDDNRLSPSVKLEEDLVPDTEGRFSCTICEKKFHEGIVLREHYEKSHTQSLLHCSTNGCNKVFLSKQSRSNHSDNRHKEKAIHAT